MNVSQASSQSVNTLPMQTMCDPVVFARTAGF